MTIPRANVAGMVIAAVLSLSLAGCGKKYAGASERTYQIATALVSVCERRATDKLEMIDTLISEGESDGRVPASQAAYLRDVVADARENRWDDAKQTARSILADQVEGGP